MKRPIFIKRSPQVQSSILYTVEKSLFFFHEIYSNAGNWYKVVLYHAIRKNKYNTINITLARFLQ